MSYDIFEYEDEEGEVKKARIPLTWEICGTCHGDGSAPFGGGVGFTASEFNETFDTIEDRADYFDGGCDLPCSDCSSTGKVKALNFANVSDEVFKAWEDEQRAISLMDAESEAERRMGC